MLCNTLKGLGLLAPGSNKRHYRQRAGFDYETFSAFFMQGPEGYPQITKTPGKRFFPGASNFGVCGNIHES